MRRLCAEFYLNIPSSFWVMAVWIWPP